MKIIKGRFVSYINKEKGLGPFGNCWQWTGATDKEGYGRFNFLRRNTLAHRVSYLLHVGKIPKNKLILHECDVRVCVNPSHLYPGTDQDNTNDKVSRGRQSPRRGETNGHAKLTEKEVRKIREMRKAGYNGHYLAKIYNVTPATIYHCATNRTWKHVKI